MAQVCLDLMIVGGCVAAVSAGIRARASSASHGPGSIAVVRELDESYDRTTCSKGYPTEN